jgi:hypothetical protein
MAMNKNELLTSFINNLGKAETFISSQDNTYRHLYDGSHSFSHQFKSTFFEKQFTKAVNLSKILVDSYVERIKIRKFKCNTNPDFENLFKATWRMNNMDMQLKLALTDMSIDGAVYATVTKPENSQCIIRFENSRNLYVEHDPYTFEVSYAMRLIRDNKGNTIGATEFTMDNIIFWSYVNDEWNGQVMPNVYNFIPVVPLVNMKTLDDIKGRSDVHDVVPLLEQLARIVITWLISADSVAVPFRILKGLEERDFKDEQGELKNFNRMTTDLTQLFVTGSTEVDLKYIPGADLRQFNDMYMRVIKDFLSITGLPAHFAGIVGDIPSSPEGINAAQGRFDTKVRDKIDVVKSFINKLVEVIAVIEGFDVKTVYGFDTSFYPPTKQSIATLMNACAQGVQSGAMPASYVPEFLMLNDIETQDWEKAWSNIPDKSLQAYQNALTSMVLNDNEDVSGVSEAFSNPSERRPSLEL